MFSTRQREIETLRSLRHENIVKLIALETEVSYKSLFAEVFENENNILEKI
jgi:serine/threonine protein kinase